MTRASQSKRGRRGTANLPQADQLVRLIEERIQSGDLQPKDPLPSRAELSEMGFSPGTAGEAFVILAAKGLIDRTPGARATVRAPRDRVTRNAVENYRAGIALGSAAPGAAEQNTGKALAAFPNFKATISKIEAGADLARTFRVPMDEPLLQRIYRWNPIEGAEFQLTTSWLLWSIAQKVDGIADEDREPWPGGTTEQLREAGIVIGNSTDRVTTRNPFAAEADALDMREGVPVMCIRKVTTDDVGRVVEVTDSVHPGDTTELVYSIDLLESA